MQRRVLAIAAVLALFGAACGDDDGADEPDASAPADTEESPGTSADDEAPDGTDEAGDEPGDESASTTGADAPEAGSDPIAEPVSLRIGYIPSLSLAPPFLADGLGLYEDENLEVEFEPITSISDALLLLAQGDLDIYVGAASAPMFNQVSTGLDVRMIGSVGSIATEGDLPAASGVYVRQNLSDSGEVESVEDLEGRKIGMVGTVGSATSFLVYRVLQTGGLGFDDVEFESLGIPETLTALQNDAVDAGFITAPYTQQAESEGTAIPIVDAKEAYGDVVTSGFIVGPNMLNDEPAAATAFLRANMRAAERLQGDYRTDDEVVSILAEFLDSEEEFVRTAPTYFFDPEMTPSTETVLEMQDVFLEIPEILAYDEPLTADDLVDTSFQQAALNSL